MISGTTDHLDAESVGTLNGLDSLRLRRRLLRRNPWVWRGRRVLVKMRLPLAAIALLVVPALILEDRTTSATLRYLCNVVNWFVWLAFVTEFLVGCAVAHSARRFLRASWFNLTVILLSPPFLVPEVFQAVRGLRAFRILRLFRLMRGLAITTIGLRSARKVLGSHGFPYVILVTLASIGLGAIGIYQVEKGFSIDSPVNALWWATVTVTTVGYGDVNPVTGEGRAIALILMLVGVGVISIFTGSVASFFVGDDRKQLESMERRLFTIEGQMSELLVELRQARALTAERDR